MELRLAVDRPAQEPAGISSGHDAAGDDLARQGIALAYVLDIGQDLVIQRVDGNAHPVALFRIAIELLRVTEGGILRGDLAPQIEGPAGTDLLDVLAGLVLPADGGVLHVAAVRDEKIVTFGQIQELLAAVHEELHTLCDLSPIVDIKADVHDLGVEMELRTMALQILDHGEDHGLILVVLRETQRPQIRQTVDMVDEALHVTLHFGG